MLKNSWKITCRACNLVMLQSVNYNDTYYCDYEAYKQINRNIMFPYAGAKYVLLVLALYV